MRKRWKLIASLALPLGLGLWAREVALWQPKLIANIGYHRLPDIAVSPDGKWLLAKHATAFKGEATPTPRLIELASGTLRQLPGTYETWKNVRWTAHSQLAHTQFSLKRAFHNTRNRLVAPSKLLFVDPQTLKTVLVLDPGSGWGDASMGWSDTQTDVWMLTQRQYLHFEARTGKLLARRRVNWNPKGYLSQAQLSPDGQKAIVGIYVPSSQHQLYAHWLYRLWDLKADKPIHSTLRVRPYRWIGNNSYFDGRFQCAFADDAKILRLHYNLRNDSLYHRLDQSGQTIAVVDRDSVRWFDTASHQLMKMTRSPKLPFKTLDFSPDHAYGYFCDNNGKIWRQRLK